MTDLRYQERRADIEQYFAPANLLDEPIDVQRSPSGEFELEISFYATKPGAWRYSRGIVRRTDDWSIVADVKRNYSSFLHSWVSSQGEDKYIVCGEDYQGYSVINLRTGVHQRYFPDAAYEGAGFCWVAAYPSPDGTVLAVDGCQWACPYELVFYDFTDPERLPLREIERIGDLYGCKGWQDDGSFSFELHYEVRTRDGAKVADLPVDELNSILKQPDAIEGRSEVRTWRAAEPRVASDGAAPRR